MTISQHLFQFTISTIEGLVPSLQYVRYLTFQVLSVKSDALFSYQPPFNLLAYFVLAPLSCFVSPRTLHTANVLLIRTTVSIAQMSRVLLMAARCVVVPHSCDDCSLRALSRDRSEVSGGFGGRCSYTFQQVMIDLILLALLTPSTLKAYRGK
jgi:hypothetical protein